PAMLDPKIKSLNYLNEILAQSEAIAADCDTAILFGEDGYLAEASAANIFLVKNEKIYTPFPNHCLAGITRATVIEMMANNGFSVMERDLTYADLFSADEIFLTSTAIDISPVIQLDRRAVGTGRIGPVTARARALFMEKMSKDSYVMFEKRPTTNAKVHA